MNHTCEMYNVEPACYYCSDPTSRSYRAKCWIDIFFNGVLISNDNDSRKEEYLGLICGVPHYVLYFRKALELKYPEHLAQFDRLALLI